MFGDGIPRPRKAHDHPRPRRRHRETKAQRRLRERRYFDEKYREIEAYRTQSRDERQARVDAWAERQRQRGRTHGESETGDVPVAVPMFPKLRAGLAALRTARQQRKGG